MDHLEFIARVTSHIPDKGQVTIRYSGLYANAHRGKRRKAEKGQSQLLIKLTFVADKPPPPQIVYRELFMAAETSAEYFS